MKLAALSLVVALLGPDKPGEEPAAQDPGEHAATHPKAPDPAPDLAELERYLGASGLDLLKLRESLEQDAQGTARACQSWWNLHPKADAAQRERVMWLWAKVDPSSAAAAVGATLAKAWQALDPEAFVDCTRTSREDERLCGRLAAFGAPAATEFLKLAQDPTLPVNARAQALELLTQLAPPDWLGQLAMQGLGDQSHASLRDPLTRALVRRAHQDPAASKTLADQIRASLADDKVSGRVGMRLWQLLTQIDPQIDAALITQLSERVADPKTSVPSRVVMARLLAKVPSAKAPLLSALDTIYPQSPISQSEAIVLDQALLALDEGTRTEFLAKHPTFASPHPPLAELAYQSAPLLPKGQDSGQLRASMLRLGLFSLWPRVQRAALERMATPCDARNFKRAYRLAGPQSKGGTQSRAVRRAAIDVLARCGQPSSRKKLARLANNDRIGALERGRALLRYVEQSPVNEKSAVAVREIVGQAPNELGRAALFAGLARLEDPPPYVIELLCAWAHSKRPLIARTSGKKAMAALQELGQAGACNTP